MSSAIWNDQFQRIGLADVDPAQPLELQQFAVHHALRQRDQQVEDVKAPQPQGDLERLHVEPVAGEHRDLVAPDDVGGALAAPRLGLVDDVVVDQRGGVDQFHHRRQLNRFRGGIAEQAATHQQQDRPQPLAPVALQIAGNVRDGVHAADRLQAEDTFHLLQVVGHQSGDFARGERQAQLSGRHRMPQV